jgi:hypothetical protein
MSNKDRRKAAQDQGFAGLPLDSLMSPWLTGMATAGDAIEPWYRSLVRANLEAMSFWSRRTLANMEAPGRIAACTSPQQLMAEGMRYWTEAARDTQQSTSRVLQALGSASLAPVNAGRQPKGKVDPKTGARPVSPSEAERIIRDILNLSDLAPAKAADAGESRVPAE